MSTPEIDFDQFLAVDLRVGRVTAVEEFPEARKPAWKLTIDFGDEIGVKRSSAQITNYAREELAGRRVVAVVNFPPRQIGPFRSEVLCVGPPTRPGRSSCCAPTPTCRSAPASTSPAATAEPPASRTAPGRGSRSAHPGWA